MRCLPPLFATPLATLLAAPVLAQEASEPEPPVIVVTGEGLAQTPAAPVAYAVREIVREQIVATPSGRVEEALGLVAGFQQFRRSDSRSSNPSAQGVTLRALGGNATSRALVLLDGVPIADPFFGYIPFGALATERLARIRVTRGGGSGPFGAGALAGTIELESAGIEDLPPLTASLLGDDRGSSEASATIAAPLGRGFAVLGGRWDRSGGFFTTPEAERVPASAKAAYESRSLGLRAVAAMTDQIELQASASGFDDRRTLRFEGADSSAQGADASLRLVGRGRWQFDALAYLQSRNFTNIVVSSTRFVPVLDQRNTPATGLGGKLELRPPAGPDHVVRIGIDYRRAVGELQEDAISAFTGAVTERRRAGGSTSDLGLFVEDDWTLGPLVVTGGLRADRSRIGRGFYEARDPAGALLDETLVPRRAEWTLTWRAGAAWAAHDDLRVRAAAYRGLRQPTLNELLRPFVVFPQVTQANADLGNEVLEGYEAGVDFEPREGLAVSLTGFHNRVEGAIANVTLAPNLRQRRNLPAIRARGIELGARAAHGPVSLDASLSLTDAETEGEGVSAALDGRRPAQSPRWAAAAAASLAPAPGWLVAASLRHTGAQFEDDLEQDRLPPATTLGAYLEAPLGAKLSLVVRAENLTGERIVTRDSDGSVDLGVPRTFWAGLRYGY